MLNKINNNNTKHSLQDHKAIQVKPSMLLFRQFPAFCPIDGDS